MSLWEPPFNKEFDQPVSWHVLDVYEQMQSSDNKVDLSQHGMNSNVMDDFDHSAFYKEMDINAYTKINGSNINNARYNDIESNVVDADLRDSKDMNSIIDAKNIKVLAGAVKDEVEFSYAIENSPRKDSVSSKEDEDALKHGDAKELIRDVEQYAYQLYRHEMDGKLGAEPEPQSYPVERVIEQLNKSGVKLSDIYDFKDEMPGAKNKLYPNFRDNSSNNKRPDDPSAAGQVIIPEQENIEERQNQKPKGPKNK